MHTTFIIGIDSLIGATLDLVWSAQSQQHILALPLVPDRSISSYSNQEEIQKLIATHQPSQIIYAGKAAESSWTADLQQLHSHETSAENKLLQTWATAAEENDAQFVFLSSDAVFTGPWMFHAETSQQFSQSRSAQAILKQEQLVQSLCPSALITRSHIIGFSPDGNSWLESLLNRIENQNIWHAESTSSATPILATDFAEFLNELLEHPFSGHVHISGAERVNPTQFSGRLADAFGYEIQNYTPECSLSPQNSNVRTETSLNSAKLRKLLGHGTPMLNETLDKLVKQKQEGFDKQIQATQSLLTSKVA